MQEARRIIDKECIEGATTYLFFGFGLGYLIEAFLEIAGDRLAVVIEPDRGHFLTALSSRDLENLLTDERLSYFVDEEPEALPVLLDSLPSNHLKLVPLRSIMGQAEHYYSRVNGIIKAYVTRKKINLNTLDRFGKLWVKNLTQNIELLLRAPGVQGLANAFAGIPALVLASGPSLDSLLPIICELRQRFLTIVVDTSLKSCIEQGTDPDFLVIVDPQYWNTRHIDGVDLNSTIIVSESSTHPRVFRTLSAPTFLGSSLFPLGRCLESAIGKKGALGAGGSVATTAWDLARLSGCHPIYIAGLDLGYPERATHFRGAYFENRFHTRSTRLRSSEEMSFSLLYQAFPFTVASNSGRPVLTDQRMIIYKWWFENQLKIHPEAKTFTLSPGGVRIEGMSLASTQSLLGFPVIRDRIDEGKERIRHLSQSSCRTDDTLRIALEESVKELIEELRSLDSLASEALLQVKALEAGRPHSTENQIRLEELNGIDDRILKTGSRDVASFLLQSLIRRIEDGGKVEGFPPDGSYSDVLKNSKELYSELRDSALYHVKYLEKALETLCDGV